MCGAGGTWTQVDGMEASTTPNPVGTGTDVENGSGNLKAPLMLDQAETLVKDTVAKISQVPTNFRTDSAEICLGTALPWKV